MNHTQQELIRQILIETGKAVCKKVHESLHTQTTEERSSVHKEDESDTIYSIDRDVEELIVPILNEKAAAVGGIFLMAEGIGEETGGLALPLGTKEEDAAIRIIMDPIDGTRSIMYDKRSAFYLAAAAPNKGKETYLSDIEVAVMVELPTSRSVLSDILSAIKGKGTITTTLNLSTNEEKPITLRPSQSPTILGGFGQIARFFPPGRAILAQIEDELIDTLFPDAPEGKTLVFEDQYISSGGQMYEIIRGHDRFVADIRATLFDKMKSEGKKIGHVCHPYDICTLLIAKEKGVIFTDAKGNELDAPFNLLYPIDWIGYANEKIKQEVEPVLQRLIKKHILY